MVYRPLILWGNKYLLTRGLHGLLNNCTSIRSHNSIKVGRGQPPPPPATRVPRVGARRDARDSRPCLSNVRLYTRFTLRIGRARTKAELLLFAQQHATHRFELPPNPHLTREQQAAWIEQVGELPVEKREAAFDSLQRETGLGREELGLPREAKEEL